MDAAVLLSCCVWLCPNATAAALLPLPLRLDSRRSPFLRHVTFAAGYW